MDAQQPTGSKPILLGLGIKSIRLRKGKTLDQVADAMGIHRGTLSKVENNKQGWGEAMLTSLANALDVEVIDFFTEADRVKYGNTEEGPDIKGTVPLISWIQAGQWQDVIDNLHPGEGERIHTTYKVRKHTYALRVRGDSMEPKFPDD